FQVFGLGDLPVILALTALAVPPMVTNSYVALREVDPDVREAARGMGYRELAQVLRVELPLAVPLIMAGVRTSAVQVVATAPLAAGRPAPRARRRSQSAGSRSPRAASSRSYTGRRSPTPATRSATS